MPEHSRSVLFVLLCGFVLCGCLNVPMETPYDKVESQDTIEPVAVTERAFRGVRMSLTHVGTETGRFAITCRGDYAIDQKRTHAERRTGYRTLSFGLLPGLYLDSDTKEGPAYLRWPLWTFVILMENAGLCGVPTILSLVYEPFADYHAGKRGPLANIASQGLIGCSKNELSYSWTSTSSRSTRERRDATSFRLYDYEISLGGVRYRCEKWEDGITVPLPQRPGASVKVRVERVPALGGDLGQYVGSLAGRDFEVTVE